MSVNTTAFLIVFIVAVVLLTWGFYRRICLVRLGKAENRFDSVGRRIWNMVSRACVQACVISRRYKFGVNHAIFFGLFWIFIVINIVFLLGGLFPDHIRLSLTADGVYHTLSFIFDLVWILIVLSVIISIIRRMFFRPSYIDPIHYDVFITLSVFIVLMIGFFGNHAALIAQGIERSPQYLPVSRFVASAFMSATPVTSLAGYANVFWWIHAVTLLGFLNYLPYTKHSHMMTAIPNSFFRSLTKVTTQHREEFKKGNTYGAAQVTDFTWKDLFDSYSCADCGRCSDVCPATNTGKPLNPRTVVHDIKVNLIKNGSLLSRKAEPVLPLIGGDHDGSISEEVLWECTTCGACVQVCPASIEHFPKIIEMRRNLVEMQAKFPVELLAFFENIEQRSNPWGIAPGERIKWAADINVKPFEAGKTEYLFYVGCFGAFDGRTKQVTLAIARILDAAGVSWGVLGKDELCCGDSLRRLGNEFVFDKLAKENVKMFQEKGIKKIITLCPHCLNTLKHDYRQYGAELEVTHHTELINRLIKERKLNLSGTEDLGNTVFHDSCYLGRYNEIYQAPREAVAAATGRRPDEMGRRYDNSFCCGAGGGRMWMEESLGKRINIERLQEALKENPRTICVCCPYCMTMFEDGLKDENADDRVQVLDLAEVVARALK